MNQMHILCELKIKYINHYIKNVILYLNLIFIYHFLPIDHYIFFIKNIILNKKYFKNLPDQTHQQSVPEEASSLIIIKIRRSFFQSKKV
jgi:hypothetical protein